MIKERTGNKVQVVCNCGAVVEEMTFDRFSSYDFFQYITNSDNNLCRTCWIKESKSRAEKTKELDEYFHKIKGYRP